MLALSCVLLALAQAEAPSLATKKEALPFQYQFLWLSTSRYQHNNGIRTTPDDAEHNPTGQKFADFLNTFGGSLTYEQLIVALRLDTAAYVQRPLAWPGWNGCRGNVNTAPDGWAASGQIRADLTDRYCNTVQLEYAAATYSDRDVSLTLGDFYVTLGRGMVLAVRKVDDVGIDNKLRGGEGKVRFGPVSIHGFAGFLNIKNFEQGTGYFYEDPNDLIIGGRAEYGFSKYLKVGAHAARILQEPRLDERREIRGFGATLELPRPVKWATFYSEVAVLDRETDAQGVRTEDHGFGLYGNLNLYLGDFTVSAEGKYYDHLFPTRASGPQEPQREQLFLARQQINQLINPPTAERPLALILSNENARGGRTRVDWQVTKNVAPYLSLGRYVDGQAATLTGGSQSARTNITSIFGGVRGHWSGGHGFVEAGHRGQHLAEDGSIVRTDTHLWLDVEHKLGGPFTGELVFQGLRVEEFSGSWLEGRASFSCKANTGWAVTAAYEFYTGSPDLYAVHYPSLGGQVELFDGWLLRGLVGAERAGLKCVGGVCRFFPGFEGARLEATLRW